MGLNRNTLQPSARSPRQWTRGQAAAAIAEHKDPPAPMPTTLPLPGGGEARAVYQAVPVLWDYFEGVPDWPYTLDALVTVTLPCGTRLVGLQLRRDNASGRCSVVLGEPRPEPAGPVHGHGTSWKVKLGGPLAWAGVSSAGYVEHARAIELGDGLCDAVIAGWERLTKEGAPDGTEQEGTPERTRAT